MALLRFSSCSVVIIGMCFAALPTPNDAAIPAKPRPSPSTVTILIKAATPAPSQEQTIPFHLLNTETQAKQKALFVIALGQDPDTRGKLTADLSELLPDYLPSYVRIVAEPQWGEKEFVSQCEAAGPDMIDGALIAEAAAASTDRYTGFLFKRDDVEVAGTAFYAQCGKPDAGTPKKQKGSATITWVSTTEDGLQTSTSPYYLPTITALFGLATAYVAFFPSRTITTVSTRVFPLPTPIPAGGTVSNIATTQTTTANPSASSSTIGNISSGLVTGYLIAAPNATPAPTSAAPGLTWSAIDRLTEKLLIATRCAITKGQKDRTSEESSIEELRASMDQTGPPLPICWPHAPSPSPTPER